MKKEQIEFFLRHQLAQFGLNPTDWDLKKSGPRSYQIKHHRDLQTYFLGVTKSIGGRIRWQDIQMEL